jgi:hypothetical protein
VVTSTSLLWVGLLKVIGFVSSILVMYIIVHKMCWKGNAYLCPVTLLLVLKWCICLEGLLGCVLKNKFGNLAYYKLLLIGQKR